MKNLLLIGMTALRLGHSEFLKTQVSIACCDFDFEMGIRERSLRVK